jgi:SAM-dependent methyltransferase
MSWTKKLKSKFYGQGLDSPAISGRDPSLFDEPFYAEITEARLTHLRTCNLPFAGKRTLDVGSGIGRLSEVLEELGANVFCIDGREENIKRLRQLYPKREAAVVDIETDDFTAYGEFHVVFCYGLLYHLADPFRFIKLVAPICREMMVIETCITDAEDPLVRLVEEDKENVTQALKGFGCRPSPAYVIAMLRSAGFDHLYSPKRLPDHAQFTYSRLNDCSHVRNGQLMRDIFVASRDSIASDKLVEHEK